MPVNLPTNLLRGFVAIVDSGSTLTAAEQVLLDYAQRMLALHDEAVSAVNQG